MPNAKFIVYDADGNILRTGACPKSMIGLQMSVDEFVIEGDANDATQYIDMATHSLKDKRVFNPTISKSTLIANGIDSITISGLPTPCMVSLDGLSYNVQDGIFEFTVDVAGTYDLRIEAVEIIPYETQVIAS